MQQPLQIEKTRIDKFLDERLPAENEKPELLHQAMRYAVLNGGKKLRALLAIAACETVGGNFENAANVAGAIELIHSYSLIHDDLPCMDDDKIRRGKPTCHVKFGEAIALLAGDALLTLAFDWLASAKIKNTARIPEIIAELARAAGHTGMVGGQVVDIEQTGESSDEENLQFIHRHKTADMITVSAAIGGIAGDATDEQIAFLKDFGYNLGMAFQYIDDILDCTATSEDMGKTVGKDEAAGKVTAVSIYGIDEARLRAERYKIAAENAIRSAGWESSKLREISEFVVKRRF